MPFVSKQKGRMSALLKQKSKVITVKKERVTYDAFDFDKRPRITQENQKSTQDSTQAHSQATGQTTQSSFTPYLETVYKEKDNKGKK